MPDAPIPPQVPSDVAIQAMLAHRLDECRVAVGLIVGVVDAVGQRIVAHGLQDGATKRRVGPDTIFEIGSVTKLFTALLLADMARRREVRLDEPVAALLPAGTRVPSRNGRDITLCDLASHHSGLPKRPTNLPSHDPDDPYAGYSADHLYEFLAGYRLARTPGDTFEYSNLGAGLLGHALVLRAGSPDFESLVRQRLLSPLGMHDTGVAIPAHLQSRVAVPHDVSLDPVPVWDLGVLAGAGALRATVSDLMLFLSALCDANSAVAPLVHTLLAPRDRGGLELGARHPDGGAAISHFGSTGGSRSFIRCVPQWGRGIAVLSNTGIDAVVDLGVHVLDTRCAPQWFRREARIEARDLARLVGRYRATPNHILDVTAQGDRLYVRRSGDVIRRVFPLSAESFFYKSINAQITFELASDGSAARLILHQDGVDQLAERLGDSVAGR